MGDIKIIAKNEKELEALIQTIRIYNQNIRMEFGIEKCAMLIIKSGKREQTEGIELPKSGKKQNPLERRKTTSTRECLKLIPSNKWKWRENEKREKSVSEEQENLSKLSSTTETSSNE